MGDDIDRLRAEPGDVVVSDEDLTALALAADPDVELGDDAVPFRTGGELPGLLPDWYMPAPQVTGRSRRQAAVLSVVVVSLLALNAAGLCVTYGVVESAW